MRATIEAAVGWAMDRFFNPGGHYDDGTRLRTFAELKAQHEEPNPEHTPDCPPECGYWEEKL